MEKSFDPRFSFLGSSEVSPPGGKTSAKSSPQAPLHFLYRLSLPTIEKIRNLRLKFNFERHDCLNSTWDPGAWPSGKNTFVITMSPVERVCKEHDCHLIGLLSSDNNDNNYHVLKRSWSCHLCFCICHGWPGGGGRGGGRQRRRL